MDRISLSLCCGKLLFPSLDDVLAGLGKGLTRVSMRMPEAGVMEVDPWMFDEGEMRFEVPARRVGKEQFESVEAFREAYVRAGVEGLKLTLRPFS